MAQLAERRNRRIGEGSFVEKRRRKKTPRALRTQETNDALEEAFEIGNAVQTKLLGNRVCTLSAERASWRRSAGGGRRATPSPTAAAAAAGGGGDEKLTRQRTVKEDVK
jgi:hypothetical protein